MSDTVHLDEAVELEILELKQFEPAFASDPDSESEIKRRFMNLFVEQPQTGDIGGSGYVSRARNARNQIFAIKRLLPTGNQLYEADSENGTDSLSSFLPEQYAAFREEYRSLLSLSHMKGFPRLYGFGETQGSPVMVMEWVEGESLEEARSKLPCGNQPGAVSKRTVAAIGSALFSILDGLDRLIDRPVHRDISPKNIMIRTSNRSLQEQVDSGDFDLCLVDFGSATAPNDVNPRLTMQSNIWRHGTPEYAPPEMLTHDRPGIEEMRLSPSIDVYAASSVLFELLLGHTPFELSKRDDLASPYVVKTEEAPHLKGAERDTLLKAILAGLEVDQEKRPSPAKMLAACDIVLGRQDAGLAVKAARGIRNEMDFEAKRLDAPVAGLGSKGSGALQDSLPRNDVWCMECGAKNEWWAQYCRSCGADLPTAPDMSKTQAIDHDPADGRKGFSVGAIVSVAAAAVAIAIAVAVVLWTSFSHVDGYVIANGTTRFIPADDSDAPFQSYAVAFETLEEAEEHGFSSENPNAYVRDFNENIDTVTTITSTSGFTVEDVGIEEEGLYVVTIFPKENVTVAQNLEETQESEVAESTKTISDVDNTAANDETEGTATESYSFPIDYSESHTDASRKTYRVISKPNGVELVDDTISSDATDNQVDGQNPEAAARYAVYLAKAKDYIEKYGEATGGLMKTNNLARMEGVCLLKTLDFDKDGNDELLIVYRDSSNALTNERDRRLDYVLEVWKSSEGMVDVILKEGIGYDGDAGFIDLLPENDGILIALPRTSGFDREISSYELKDGKFVNVDANSISGEHLDRYTIISLVSDKADCKWIDYNIEETQRTLEQLANGAASTIDRRIEADESKNAYNAYRNVLTDWGLNANNPSEYPSWMTPAISLESVFAYVQLDDSSAPALLLADPTNGYRIQAICRYEQGELLESRLCERCDLFYCGDGIFRVKSAEAEVSELAPRMKGDIYFVGQYRNSTGGDLVSLTCSFVENDLRFYPLESIEWNRGNRSGYWIYKEGVVVDWFASANEMINAGQLVSGDPYDKIAELEKRYPSVGADDADWHPLLLD